MIGPSGRRWSDERTVGTRVESERGRPRVATGDPTDAEVMRSGAGAPPAQGSSTGAPADEAAPGADQSLSYPSAQPASLTETDGPGQPTYVPLVDVIDADDEVRVIVDTPGFDEDDITIEADEDVLIITAERDVDEEEEGEAKDRRSRIERPRALERVVPLPIGVDVEEASASSENGTTTITFERDEDEQHNEIGFQ